MYEVERNELLPTRLFAGDFPVVTDIAKVKADTPIEKHTVVALTATGIEAASAETLNDIYGITADAADGGEDVVIYLTGEFKEEAITFPTGAEAEKAKTPLRKLNIFIK